MSETLQKNRFKEEFREWLWPTVAFFTAILSFPTVETLFGKGSAATFSFLALLAGISFLVKKEEKEEEEDVCE